MNNSSPFAQQNSTPEQKTQSRARVRLAVYCILSVHVVGLMALLMIGCRKPQQAEEQQSQENTNPAMTLDTSNVAPAVEPTNTSVATTSAPPIEPTPAPAPVMPVPTPEPAPVGQEYTIVKGDTFATIAKKFPGVTAKAIQDANPTVQPTKLKIGQKIQIPAPSVPAAGSSIPSAAMSDISGEIYTVKSNDTLTSIARSHGVTVKALRTANNLTTDRIRVGQKLKIPAKAVPAAPAPAEPLTIPSTLAPTSAPAPTHP